MNANRTLDYCMRIQNRIERYYGVKVVTRDIPAPLIGDLNGEEIHIDPRVTPEQRLFLLAHLFGHTVQWNTDPHAFDLGRLQPPVSEERLPGVAAYEREAASYGLDLIHRMGIGDIDQWFTDYGACDMAYLLHFYRTGEKREFSTFWRDGTPLLLAKTVPHFTPTKKTFRMEGVVI